MKSVRLKIDRELDFEVNNDLEGIYMPRSKGRSWATDTSNATWQQVRIEVYNLVERQIRVEAGL